MFNRINIKTLSIVFGVLLIVVLLSQLLGNGHKNQSFNSQLTDFNVDQVNGVVIIPKVNGEEVRFEKQGQNWMVSQGDQTFNADNKQIANMLESIAHLKAKRLASKNESGWEKYKVTDSLAVQVDVSGDDGELAHLYIGKFSYSQPPKSQNPYQQNQGVMTSFVRLADEEETYAVDGFLKMSFDKDIKNYRDQSIINIPKDEIAQVKVVQPNGNFLLKKSGDLWMMDGVAADSAASAQYISKLGNLRSRNFLPSEQFSGPSSNYEFSILDANGQELVKIDALYSDSAHIAMRSSINPGTVFDGTKSELFKKIFVNKAILK